MSCHVNFPLQDIVLLLREKINAEIIGAVPEERLEEEVLLFIQPKLDLLQQQLDQLPGEIHAVSQNLDGFVLETVLNTGEVISTDLYGLVSYNGLSQRQINDGLESVAQLADIANPRDGMRVYVKSYHAGLNKGGGTFVYDSLKASVNDGGNVINGWVRQVNPSYLNVMNFGAKGDGVANDANAFISISNFVKQSQLRDFFIHAPSPTTEYLVNGQTWEQGIGFTTKNILDIDFASMTNKNVILQSDNAKVKFQAGQYFGSFDKNTKQKLNTVSPIYEGSENYNLVKDVITVGKIGAAFNFNNINGLLTIGRLEIDGNRDGMVIGGVWGDTGWQIPAYGFRVTNVKRIDISNIYSHHHCLDGFYIAGYNTDTPDVVLSDVKGSISNITSTHNSRQALSLTGGQNLSFYDSTFDKTGLPEFSVRSMPMQNLDIEGEISAIRNVSFYNCFFGDTPTVSVAASVWDAKDVKFYNCKVINSLGTTIWVDKPSFKFIDCYINGRVEKNYATEIDSERTIYERCIFTDDPAVNPNLTNPNKFYLFIASGANPKLIDCTFNLYKSGSIYSSDTSAKYPILFDNLIINAYVAGENQINGVGTIRLRDYRPQADRTDSYFVFGGNKITLALDKTDDIGNKFIPYGAYASINADVSDPDYIVFAPQTKKLDAVANSTLTDDTATKLNALLATLKAKGYM